MAWMGKQKRKGRGDEMRSNYTQLLAWLPATASFTVQVQVCVSVCVRDRERVKCVCASFE